MGKRRFSFYRYMVCLMVLILLSGLTGCRLAADKTSGAVFADDVLCGAFLTFDEDGMYEKGISDTASSSMGGGVRIRNKSLTEGNSIVTGIQKDNTVKFEGVKGYFIGFVREKKANTDNTVFMSDNGFTDISQNIKDSNGITETVSEATFLLPTDNYRCYYIYPVYRKTDGAFYTVLGSSSGTSFTGDMVNTMMSTQLDNVMEERTDGYITRHVKQSIKINLKTVDPVKKIIIKEMSSEDEVITTAEVKNYGSSRLNYKATPGTEYVIIEETLHNNKTGDYINRSIYSFGKDKNFYHSCNFPTENDFIGAVQLVISK